MLRWLIRKARKFRTRYWRIAVSLTVSCLSNSDQPARISLSARGTWLLWLCWTTNGLARFYGVSLRRRLAGVRQYWPKKWWCFVALRWCLLAGANEGSDR
uniref:Putative secreted protein n=1 Tax=Anopheles darlingi TaxID=43151 RepID=A0A2M4DHU3_ANODA